MQVYDIEVEGTHNFIAQGIVAHNTYIGGSKQNPETGSSPMKRPPALSSEEVGRYWDDFQSELVDKGLSLPEFRHYIPGVAYAFKKELKGEELKIIFFIIEENQKEFHSYELYYLGRDIVGYGINELLPDGVIDLSMHIFKEQRGSYSKDIWEHRLASLLSIYEGVGRNKSIKSFLVRPNQFSYVQPESDIAEGPRALFFYLKNGFRPEDSNLNLKIEQILKELEERKDENIFTELGERLKNLGITIMPLYLKIGEGSSASSAVENKKGGVDFRALPIMTQPSGIVPLGRSEIGLSGTVPINLDEEWQQIQNMLNAGIIPSSQRLKEFLEASCEGIDCAERTEDALGIIADILRLEEERVAVTEPALRELLVLLESCRGAPFFRVDQKVILDSPAPAYRRQALPENQGKFSLTRFFFCV